MLIRQLLAFSRKQTARTQTLWLNNVVDEPGRDAAAIDRRATSSCHTLDPGTAKSGPIQPAGTGAHESDTERPRCDAKGGTSRSRRLRSSWRRACCITSIRCRLDPMSNYRSPIPEAGWIARLRPTSLNRSSPPKRKGRGAVSVFQPSTGSSPNPAAPSTSRAA